MAKRRVMVCVTEIDVEEFQKNTRYNRSVRDRVRSIFETTGTFGMKLVNMAEVKEKAKVDIDIDMDREGTARSKMTIYG